MPKQNQNDLEKPKKPAATKQGPDEVPSARGGGQIDSATGGKPGGGGQPQGGKK